MSDIYPLTIVKDKHNGIYSGGKWTAWNRNPWEISHIVSSGDDKDCADLFSTPNLIFGRGETPQEAIDDLQFMMDYGNHMTMERIKEVNESIYNKKLPETPVTDTMLVDDYNRLTKENKELAKENKELHEFENVLVKDYNKLKEEKEEYEGKYVCLNGVPYYAEDIRGFKEALNNLEEKDLARQKAYNILEKNLKEMADRIKELEELKTPTIENFADEEPSSRRDILRCAEKCVCGQREQDYGTPESNFQLIADLWNDYLGNNLSKEKKDFENELGIVHKKLSVPWQISAMDVSMMMALMKIARIRNGGGSGDSFVDLAGYAACGGEIWHLKKETNGDSSQETN